MRWRAAAVTMAIALTGLGSPAAAVSDPDVAGLEREGAALAARRAELLARVAELTDGAERAHARLVAAQHESTAAVAAATAARAALVDHAVEAFIHGSTAGEVARARGRILAEVVTDLDQAVVEAVAVAEDAARAERTAAESALVAARRATEEVAAARLELEGTIARHDVLTAAARAEQERNARARRLAEAEEARRAEAEEARRAEAEAAEAARPAAAGTVPVLPGAEGGRVARATAAQTALMAIHPFGPVAGLPPGMSLTGDVVEGMASWYGPGFDGRPTASGAVYDQRGWTVASKELPLGTVLLVTRGDRSVLALVNDRGPYVGGRVLDLSRAVAEELGTVAAGVAPVRAQVVRLP